MLLDSVPYITILLFGWLASGALAQEIPIGFKIERYAPIWEHNPFTMATPAISNAQPSAFDKLFLTSWMRSGSDEVVFIQNSDTNKVQRVTRDPGENNLRLVQLERNADPRLVEAVIFDGKEQGTIKFRFDTKPPDGQSPPGTAEIRQDIGPRQTAKIPQPSPLSVGITKAQTSPNQENSLAAEMIPHRIYPGIPRVHVEGGSGPAPPRR
jgi:hypothetical protein